MQNPLNNSTLLITFSSYFGFKRDTLWKLKKFSFIQQDHFSQNYFNSLHQLSAIKYWFGSNNDAIFTHDLTTKKHRYEL